ncbi:methyl-accepting chemotaxis protein [Rhodoferax sp.]|uniref:methyl-accepting chemotaxis protein n=1 Tax=Rhodoferax sp. TaxID=50421 RepID=UPI0025E0D66B|nr:methyl-accepting chemotaxis protein [Rhodoferax sp.]
MKFNDMRVAHKLWATILGLLLAMLLVTVWTQMRTRQVNDTLDSQVAQYEDAITVVTGWRGMVEMAVSMNIYSVLTTDEAQSKVFEARAAELTAKINPIQERMNKAAEAPADKAALDKITSTRADIRALSDKVKQLKEARDTEASQAFMDKDYKPRAAVYLEAMDKYLALQVQQRDAARLTAQAASSNVALVAMASVVVVFALGVLLALWLVRSITLPLERAVAVTGAIAAGDLTLDIQDPRKDEFGHLLRSLGGMVARLRGVVAEVRTGVDSVSTASNEIATGNNDLSARTEQTASNLQQAAASMEELTSTVSQAADTARQANQLASTAAQAATRGGEVVAQVITTMQHISTSSKRIADIIGTIDGIAFQTNILALNAAVEAARAGEQGRGFAVVASEVRSLAQRSADAAKEIKTLIGASVQTVEAGTQQVTQAGATMGEIVSSVGRVSDLIGEISAASSEQRDGIAQVNQAVNHLDQMTQQNAALVEQSAAAATGLRDQAHRLAEVVSVFNVGGHTAPTHRLAAPVQRSLAAPMRPAIAARPPVAKALPGKPAIKYPVKALGLARAPVPAKPAPALRRPVAITAKPAPVRPAAPKGGEGDWESF